MVKLERIRPESVVEASCDEDKVEALAVGGMRVEKEERDTGLDLKIVEACVELGAL